MNTIRTDKSCQPNGGAEPLAQLTGENTQPESSPERSGNSEQLEQKALDATQNGGTYPSTEDTSTTKKKRVDQANGLYVLCKTPTYDYIWPNENLAAEIKARLELNAKEWLYEVVCSDLPLWEKRARIEYAIEISDHLLEFSFPKIFDENTDWEKEQLAILVCDELGFTMVDRDLLTLGHNLRTRGYLTNKEKSYLRETNASGRWKMQKYVEQLIAVVAAETCPECIPWRFKKALKPRVSKLHEELS
jgi:hypothetical protein